MRVLICGSRDWDDPFPIEAVVLSLRSSEGAVVIEGCAPGADCIAGKQADFYGVMHEHFPADWTKYKRAAGPIRNQQMLVEGKPDVVFAFHNDIKNSKGTKDMVTRAEKAGVPVYTISRS